MSWEERLAVKIKASVRPMGRLGAKKEAKVSEGRRRTKDRVGRNANPRLGSSAPENSTQATACGATARTCCRRHARPPWLDGVHGDPTFGPEDLPDRRVQRRPSTPRRSPLTTFGAAAGTQPRAGLQRP